MSLQSSRSVAGQEPGLTPRAGGNPITGGIVHHVGELKRFSKLVTNSLEVGGRTGNRGRNWSIYSSGLGARARAALWLDTGQHHVFVAGH